MDFNNLQEDWKKQAPTLAAMEKKNPFVTPAGYFESLQTHLEALISINHKDAGSINPFTVPDGYFDKLHEQLNSRILIEDTQSKSSEGFTVSADYFQTLHANTQARIFAEQLKEQISDAGFTVPAGYFEQLENRIQSSAGIVKPVVKIRTIQLWVQYAAAACITIAIGTGIFLNQKNIISSTDEGSKEISLSAIPNDEIVSYLELHSDVGDTPVILETLGSSTGFSDIEDDVTKDELQQYLNSTF